MVYAVLGSSRDLAVGPVSIASLVMGSMLRDAVSPSGEPLLFLQLAFTSTLFAGVVQASLGILRLGFIIDFLSRATLVGFMAGAAIIVSLQQLKALLGITHFTTQMGLVPVMASVFHHTKEVYPYAYEYYNTKQLASVRARMRRVLICLLCTCLHPSMHARSGRGRRLSACASWCSCSRPGMWYVNIRPISSSWQACRVPPVR